MSEADGSNNNAGSVNHLINNPSGMGGMAPNPNAFGSTNNGYGNYQNQNQNQNQQRVVDAKGEPKSFTDMTPILQHVKSLEETNSKLKAQLEELSTKNNKLSERTRSEMQKVLDTVMAKFGDALDSNDSGMKEKLMSGMKRLVENSADENGVWKMMVCASNLYEQQIHQLDKLRIENNELKDRVNGTFGSESSRVGDKRKAEEDPEHQPAYTGDIWEEFKHAFKEESF